MNSTEFAQIALDKDLPLKEDIRMLVEYFIGRYARKAGKTIDSSSAMCGMSSSRWNTM